MSHKVRRATDPSERFAISEVPEVQEVQDIKLEIDALKGEHPEVFMRLAELIDRYNMAVDAAEKVIRGRGISCGPFQNISTTVKYDAEKMFDELGSEMFFEAGGKTEKKTVYSVDREKVETAINTGKIPEDCVAHFRTVSRSYKKPEKLVAP
jgi:hypothetical protein